MEENKNIDNAVVAAISMALSAYCGDNIHDEESGVLSDSVGIIAFGEEQAKEADQAQKLCLFHVSEKILFDYSWQSR